VLDVDRVTVEQRRRVLNAGARALDKVRAGGQVDLEPEEELGLEAVIRFTARPAILITGGRFLDPPPPWGRLEEYREGIEATARSVGRIQIAGLPNVPYGGTGFLVADDVLMTNCHVARLFVDLAPDRRWVFREGLGSSVDFVEDPDTDPPVELAVEELIGFHERLDLALLRVSADAGGGPLPAPLTLMSEPPDSFEQRQLYVLGYPAPDPRNDPVALRQVFGDIYYVKRLQPGGFLVPPPGPAIRVPPCSAGTQDQDVFAHDASTLGGNSGSCVVDLESNLVAGLHYGGFYTKYNQAVALWTLTEDPMLTRAGVQFD
jgi:hypothetical protein